jgi:hypothetical protein
VSFIQWANLAEWQYFPAKLGRIDLMSYGINLLGSLLGAIVFSLACVSLGMFLTKALKLFGQYSSQSILSRLALSSTHFLLGHAFFSLIFLALCGLYELTPFSVAVILFLGLVSGLSHFKSIFPQLFVKEQLHNRKDRIIFWLSTSILLLALLQSSARISYDSTAIYFSDAKLTASANQIQFFTTGTFEASVFQTAIQYTALIQLFGDQAARMFSWVCGVIIIIFSLALGERVGLSKQASAILFAVLMTSTAFIDLLGDGKVDLISSMPAIAAVYWMVVHNQNQSSEKSTYLLIGFLIGLAIIGRPFNAFLLVIFTVLFYLQRAFLRTGLNLSSFNLFFDSIFWISTGAIGLGVYHLFANWMILGDPFAFISSAVNINSASGPWDADPDQILALRLLYPFVATFRNTPQSLGNISPFAIAFLPALLLPDVRKKLKLSRELLSLVAISAVTILLWIISFFTVVELRYVLFLWIILFLPTAEIIVVSLKSGNHLFQVMTRGLIILLLLFINFRALFISLDSYSPLDQQGNPVCHDYVFCEYLKPINQSAASGDRVLTLGAYRYYLRTDLFECSTTHEEYSILQDLSYQDHEAFWREVYRRGYKYIAYENDYTVRHLRFGIVPDYKAVPAWIELEPIFGHPDDLVVAYRIHYLDPLEEIEYSCTQVADGKWKTVKIR